MSAYYTIYLSKNDEVVASVNATDCMKQMNIKSLNAFYSMVSKSKKKYVKNIPF